MVKFNFSVVEITFAILLLVSGEVTTKKLVVVLIDGVRWDYLNDESLKGFRRIMDNGVKASYVVPVFPSLSYPNWQTIITGLYPENHGFVGNNVYDSTTDRIFSMQLDSDSTDPRWWNDAEPIWITAEKHNKTSALYWWAGCEVEIRGFHPTICERQYQYDLPPEEVEADFLERTDDFIQLFKPSKLGRDRLSFVLMYYTYVDAAGHRSGPDSAAVKESLRNIDAILDKMQQKIEDAHLENEVNFMVVSDHGMTDVRKNVVKHIGLNKYADKIKYQLDNGAVAGIVPQPGMLDQLVKEISDDKIEGIQIYKKEDIPEKYHLKGNRRTPPLLVIAKKGYFIDNLQGQVIPGHHGYDPEEVEDMRTVFLATGPDFRKGFTTGPLYNIDLYNVMCHILQIPALPNNGSWERVQPMLT